jgi:hypothetical protein
MNRRRINVTRQIRRAINHVSLCFPLGCELESTMARRAYMIALAAGVLTGCCGLHAGSADHRPVIALPGNPQVPVVIDDMPASGALVSGDWGLYAPGRVVPEVLAPVYGPVDPVFAPYAPYRGYYPRTGNRPRYGRQEVIVPRRPLPPAPTYYRSWSSESPDSGPVTDYPPSTGPGDYPQQDFRNGDNQNQQNGLQRDKRRHADTRNQHDDLPQHFNKRRGHRGFGPHPRFPHRGGHSMLPRRGGHSVLPRRGGHS